MKPSFLRHLKRRANNLISPPSHERDQFKQSILEVIGQDLNGYHLEDAAIDYLEQTPLNKMDPNNVLDSIGIKLINGVTAKQAEEAVQILRNKEGN